MLSVKSGEWLVMIETKGGKHLIWDKENQKWIEIVDRVDLEFVEDESEDNLI